MRHIGTKAMGIRLPIITKNDDLPSIIADSLLSAIEGEGIELRDSDVLGITEAIVAKAQGNYADVNDIADDVAQKFPEKEAGLVFPIFSRNRFLNILKGISGGLDKLYVLLQYPQDEFGNPIMDIDRIDEIEEAFGGKLISAEDFRDFNKGYLHPFTQMDYLSLYEGANDNIEVYFSNNPRDILKLTKNVIVGEVHRRELTKKRLLKAGAQNVCLLSDILSSPVNGSGYNDKYGVLGSNMSTENVVKLFPRDCDTFVKNIQKLIKERTGVSPEVLVYGDGAFKDPAFGIWELADPVVSPGHTERLAGQPNEIKLKFVADNDFAHLSSDEKREAISNLIKDKNLSENLKSEGTTPRKYADLIGSLCDLMSGSGDKGTPVILIQGYFDDYAAE